MSLVSIIIPTYNRAHLITETLNSILNQTYSNWECIIVDDGSTDETFSVVKKYIDKDDRFSFYTRPLEMKKGPNSCRNFGFEKSKGDFVYWFDSDDLLFDFSLEKRIMGFEEATEVVIGKADFFDSISKEIIFSNKIYSERLIEDYFIGNVTFYVSGPIWKKSFLLKNEVFFDEDIRYLDDWDYNLRILYKNPKIIFLDEVLFLYRSHPNSLSKQINFLNIEELKSECLARNKHYNLLKSQNLVTPLIEKFLLGRYRIMLRDTLVNQNKESWYFLLNLIRMQMKCMKYKDAFLSTFGFIVYKVFNKGYVLIK